MRLLDHRGILPASIANKTTATIGTLDTVRTTTGGSYGAGFKFSYRAFHRWAWQNHPFDPQDPNSCGTTHIDEGLIVMEPPNPTQNILDLWTTAIANFGQHDSHIHFELVSSNFGPFDATARFDEGTEILKAEAPISASGITRVETYRSLAQVDCDGNVVIPAENPPPKTEVKDISYAIVGFTGEQSFEVLQTVTGASNGSTVADVTTAAQKMYADRNVGLYARGYGVLIVPDTFGNLEELIPPEGPTRVLPYCEGDPCYGHSGTYYYEERRVTLKWGNISFGQVWLTVKYPDGHVGHIPWPRLPIMGAPDLE